jgi:hypothetical protein
MGLASGKVVNGIGHKMKSYQLLKHSDKNIPLDNIVMDWQYWKPDEWGSQNLSADFLIEGNDRYTKMYNAHFRSQCGQSFIQDKRIRPDEH